MPVKKANSKLQIANRKIRNKKIRTTETRKRSETQKFRASRKLSGSVVARKASKVSRPSPKSEKKAPQAGKRQAPRASLSTSVYNLKGKVIGKVALPKEIFGADINDKLISQAVRVYLANQRQGTAKTKTRGEVKGSTRKIYRQKGTGRARHGSIRAPIFVHGGRAFGPKPRDFSLNFPQKMKRASLFSALSSKLRDNEIKVLTGLEKIEPKTKKAYEVVKNLSGEDRKILLVTPAVKNIENIYRSFRNIKNLEIMNANFLNTYKVIDNKLIFLMRDAISSIKDNFLKKYE